MAGCGDKKAEPVAAQPEGNAIEGWVLDNALLPVAGAEVTAVGTSWRAAADEDGFFAIAGIVGQDTLTLRATAPGYDSASRTILFATPEQRQRVDFTLGALPSTSPYIRVHQYDGFIECSAFVAVGHNHGGGGPPEGESPTDCGTYQTTDAAWDVPIDAGISGLVLEVIWEADTDLADNLLALVHQVHPNGTLEYLAFNEGTSPLKVPFSAFDMQARFQRGGTIHVDVQIGGGPDQEDVAFGAAIQQRFQAFTSQFWGQIPDPHYTVAP